MEPITITDKVRAIMMEFADLSRPLVPSMGLHDPLDAFVTHNELRYCARKHPGDAALLDIDDQIAEAAAMCEGKDFATDDPLGIGGLLFDACRVSRTRATGAPHSRVWHRKKTRHRDGARTFPHSGTMSAVSP